MSEVLVTCDPTSVRRAYTQEIWKVFWSAETRMLPNHRVIRSCKWHTEKDMRNTAKRDCKGVVRLARPTVFVFSFCLALTFRSYTHVLESSRPLN